MWAQGAANEVQRGVQQCPSKNDPGSEKKSRSRARTRAEGRSRSVAVLDPKPLFRLAVLLATLVLFSGSGLVGQESDIDDVDHLQALRDLKRARKSLLTAPGPRPLPLVEELRRDARQRAGLRELVGESRWRRMQETRFLLDRYERDSTTTLFDRPEEHDFARRSLQKVALKAMAELAEKRLGVDEWLERRDSGDSASEDENSGPPRGGVSLSPRVRLGSDPGLGVRLRLKGGDPIWSRFGIEARQRFESGELGLRLYWRKPGYSYELSHTLNDRHSLRHHGEKDRVLSFLVRMSI